MKGGPSIEVLLDLALEKGFNLIANQALDILKTQVFLYEADMERIERAYKKGNSIAEELLLSYSKAEFFTKLPDIPEKLKLLLMLLVLVIFQQIYFHLELMLILGQTENSMGNQYLIIIK